MSSKTSVKNSTSKDLIDSNSTNPVKKKLNYVNLVVNTSNVLHSDMFETRSPVMLLTSDFPTATLLKTGMKTDRKNNSNEKILSHHN